MSAEEGMMRAFRIQQLGFTAVLAWAVVACASLGSPEVPDTPEGAVRFFAAGLAEGRPQVLWQGLPQSWQTELTAYLHEVAEKTDPELYAAGWGLAGKVARILDEKREFILDHPMLAPQMKERTKAEAMFSGLAALLHTLAGSELADREALGRIDVEKFLADTGATLLRQATEMASSLEGMGNALPPTVRIPVRLEQLRPTEVAVVSRTEDASRLRLVLADGKTSEQDWVRIEGRWVPKTMADTWPKAMERARRQLAEAVPATPERKQAALVQLGMVHGALDAVLDTKTAAEFQAAASTALGTLLGVAMAQAQAPAPAPSLQRLPEPAGAQEVSQRYLRAHAVALGAASRHVGEPVHVIGVDGVEFDGILRAADARSLTIERESSAGTMTHAMAVNEVSALQIWR